MNELTPLQALVQMARTLVASKEKRLKLLYNERALVINHLASIDRLITEVEAEPTKETHA